MNHPSTGQRTPDPSRSGVRSVPRQPAGPGRICDNPDLLVPAIIYAWPIYEIDPNTGLMLPPDPVTGQRPIRLDYVGQTIRPLDVRSQEHLDDKPWADLAVGTTPIIVEQGVWTKKERDAREVAAIDRIRPRYNHDDNLHNPLRIEIWRQLEQRHARDATAGRPPWIPSDLRRRPAAGLEAPAADLTPLDVAVRLARATGRWLLALPRRLQLAALTVVIWTAGSWSLAAWLTELGWPDTLALASGVGGCTVLTPAVLRIKLVRRWARRRR